MQPKEMLNRLQQWINDPKNATPVAWCTSALIHLTILLLAILLIPPLVHGMHDVSREQAFIPDTTLATDGNFGGLPNPGLGKDPSREQMQPNQPADTHGFAEHRPDNLAAALSASASGSQSIGAGEKSAGNSNHSIADLFSGEGGQLATFGPRGGGGGNGPRSKIFGMGSNVRSVIYVCDASGSMIGQGDDILRTELKRSVNNLAPVQQFNVLIFHQTDTGALYQKLAEHLLVATPHNKQLAFDFVDNLRFSNVNNPIPALQEAFREKPQLVFLLSHGDFSNRYNTTTNQEVLDVLDRLNADKFVRINTRLLLGDRGHQVEQRADFEAIMQQIAGDNGGNYQKHYNDEF